MNRAGRIDSGLHCRVDCRRFRGTSHQIHLFDLCSIRSISGVFSVAICPVKAEIRSVKAFKAPIKTENRSIGTLRGFYWPIWPFLRTRPTILHVQRLVNHRSIHSTAVITSSKKKTTKTSSKDEIALSSRGLDLHKTRNIGIVAHIDAGKTTTTERMLFYSGFTRSLGDVDTGSTVMDYLPEERARGITINSAAITMKWQVHRINLIDTPGHADFTFEVERAIRVLDGVVCILDAVKGVEAQTEKVWHQADAYGLSRIIFVNKLDRIGADFRRCIVDCVRRLRCVPVAMQLPLFDGFKLTGALMTGVIDVLHRKVITWDEKDLLGRAVHVEDLAATDIESSGSTAQIPADAQSEYEAQLKILNDECERARTALVEICCTHDEKLIEHFLTAGAASKITAEQLAHSIRYCTSKRYIVPVFCGAALRNIGVQPLLDAILSYLPAPSDVPPPRATVKGRSELLPVSTNLCALAFKVVHDQQRGMLTFVRVYSGTMKRNATLRNTSSRLQEKIGTLYYAFADDFVATDALSAGEIGVIIGAKNVQTGDTLVDENEVKNDTNLKDCQLMPITIPESVFTAAIEPRSQTDQYKLEQALKSISREDPSLKVTVDEKSGQQLLSGMGELHIEIAWNRLQQHYKVDGEIGDLDINYRETIYGSHSADYTLDEQLGTKTVRAAVSLTVTNENGDRAIDHSNCRGGISTETRSRRLEFVEISEHNLVFVDVRVVRAIAESLRSRPDEILDSLVRGAKAGLLRGNFKGYPLYGLHIKIESIRAIPGQTLVQALAIAVQRAVSQIVREARAEECALLEPYMDVTVIVEERNAGRVTHDLVGKRHAQIHIREASNAVINTEDEESAGMVLQSHSGPMQSDYDSSKDVQHIYIPRSSEGDGDLAGEAMKPAQQVRQIDALVPLRYMLGYNKTLQQLTGGRASYSQSFANYQPKLQ